LQASSAPDVWLRLTSLFLPAALRADPERHRSGRISVGILVAASCFALQWVPAYPLVMPPEAAWPLTGLLAGCVALSLALLFACRWSHTAAVHALLAYVTLMFFVAEQRTGGHASFIAIWNLTLPVCAMLVGGGRAAWTWLGIALGHYALLFGLAQAGIEFPNLIWPEMRLPIAAFSVASLTLLVLMLGALSELAHTSGLQSLQAVRAELVAARDAAEAASGAKAEFLANASHEIRTPMTAVLGFADVLLDECDPATTPEVDRDALLTMRRNAAQLLDVINDILDLAKLEAGRLQLDPAPFSPSELLRDALAAFRPEARQRGIALEVETEPGLPDRVHGDRARIAQVLLHLVANAIKFTERGGVTVRARYDASRLRIEVADTGIGMTPEQLGRLFEPFSQGDGSSTRARAGAGIGLSLCKRLVDLMGGEIRAESAPGRGTTFRLELAAGTHAAAVRPAERDAADAGAAPAPGAQRAWAGKPLWGRIERYFLPVRPVEPESIARARIIVASALAAMAFVPVFTAMWALVLPAPVAARLIACQFVVGAVCLLALVSLRRTGSALLASHLLLACYLGLCAVGTLVTGGAMSPHLGWVALLPPFALAFLGWRGASAWSAAGALFPIALLVAHRMGVESRDVTPTHLWSLTWLVTVASQTVLTSVLALVYERSREESLRGLEQTNAALARMRDAAERASRARSEFLANVSHEIRTPMTSVLGFADLLSGEWRDAAPERLEALQTIRRNGAHLLALLGDLLDLSQIEAGRLAIQRVAFAPAALAAEVAGLLRERAEAKGLELRVQISPAVPARVFGDPTRTRQILVNLLGNAVKFTRRGRVELVLDADGAAPQTSLRLEVRDTGVGIEPEKLSALFQRFVQADERVAAHFGGSGLGLAICRRLAELLGGSIEATSERGVGSRFRVTLPAEPVAEPAPALPAAPNAPRRRSSALHGRVLLAEDGPDNQNLILRVLRNAGAEVELAENGAQAREAALAAQAEGRPFGAILMDLEMPVQDGVSVTRELRARGVTTPIIALTAHAKGELPAESRDAGFDDFASKPIDRRALLDTIGRWLASPKAHSAPE
jgi:signal transduction histidine kinase/ActR/RegA family two-component response regulator